MAGDGQERLEDVFQEEIIKSFATIQDFVKFAKSCDGLRLEYHDVQHIMEDNSGKVEDQKIQILEKWRHDQGATACPKLIRDLVENYFSKRRLSVTSDATIDSESETSPITKESTAATQFRQITGTEGAETVNITHIHGAISGPVLMGNQQVAFGGGAASQGPLAIDPDVPSLKPSSTEISPEVNAITVGSCKVDFPYKSVEETTKAAFSYSIHPGPAPGGYVHATSMLSCNPPFEGYKDAAVTMETWCSTRSPMKVGIFTNDPEGGWNKIREAFLNDEGHFELHYCSINNLAAFVPTGRLSDIQFKISCFLFNDADGKFAMGFCLQDKAIENVFKYRLKKENFFETIKNLDHLVARIGDEISFKITGQHMENTKFDVDEEFVSSFQGLVYHCKPDKDAEELFYGILQRRDGEIVFESQKTIHGKKPAPNVSSALARDFSARRTNVDFRGNLEADNFIGSVENADIDMRTYDDRDNNEDDADPFWKENNTLAYEEAEAKKKRGLKKKDEVLAKLRSQGRRQDTTPRRPGQTSITFHGDVKAKTMITDAKNVRIDQRRYKGKRGEKSPTQPKVQRLIKPEQESGGTGKDLSEDEGKTDSSQGPKAEVEEQPEAKNDAVPIYDDDDEKEKNKNECEKSSKGSKDSGKMKSSDAEKYHEKSKSDNLAEPFSNDFDTKGSRGGDSEETDQGATSGIPEVDLRERRKRNRNRDGEGNVPEEKKEKKSVDNLHVFLGLCVVICLGFILYTAFTK